MKKITIYTGPLCNYCDAAKRLLARNNAPYEEIDVAKVDGAKDEIVTDTEKSDQGTHCLASNPSKCWEIFKLLGVGLHNNHFKQ